MQRYKNIRNNLNVVMQQSQQLQRFKYYRNVVMQRCKVVNSIAMLLCNGAKIYRNDVM